MDPRQQQRTAPSQRPPYLQASHSSAFSSAPASVFQSSSSLASVSSINTASAVPQTARMPPGSAPLPSPSAEQPTSYFGSIANHTATASTTTNSYTPQNQRIPLQQQQNSSQYVGQRGDGGGAPETTPYLQDFGLLAEAAKRAQMACLSRDLGDIGL